MSTTRRRADGGVPALWLVTRTDSNKTTSYLVYNAWITTNKEIHIELPAQPSMAFACLLVCLLACLLACVLQRFRAPILMRLRKMIHIWRSRVRRRRSRRCRMGTTCSSTFANRTDTRCIPCA